MRLTIFSSVFVSVILLSLPTYGTDDNVIFQKMIRNGFSLEEIKAHYKTGCASGVQSYMNICSEYHRIAEDVDLNETYQVLMTKLTKESTRKKLLNAQRAWLAFRNLNCEFETVGWEGGSGRAMLQASCERSMDAERTKRLNEYLECREDGFPCDWE